MSRKRTDFFQKNRSVRAKNAKPGYFLPDSTRRVRISNGFSCRSRLFLRSGSVEPFFHSIRSVSETLAGLAAKWSVPLE